MKKNKFITAVCVVSAFVSSNLQAKTTKSKKISSTSSLNKNSSVKKSHSGKNTGIYSIPSKNTSPLLETKMSELRQKHTKVMASGSAKEKRKVAIEKNF